MTEGTRAEKEFGASGILRKLPPSFTMSNMKITRQEGGYVSSTLLALIVVSVLLFGSLGFGTWAFVSRQDYKNNSDKKAEAAADQRQKDTEEADAKKFAEEEKNPLETHKAPDQFGGVTVQYPKTWSAYIIEDGRGSTAVDNYFHPSAVPNVDNNDNTFALRVQVIEKSYDTVIKSYDSDVSSGKLVAAPYAFSKVPDVVGTRFEGQVEPNKQGVLVVVPVRNMTLLVWTESVDFLPDFNNIILPNLVFSP